MAVRAQQRVGVLAQIGLYREQRGYSVGVCFVTAVLADWKESSAGRFDKGYKITEEKILVSKRPEGITTVYLRFIRRVTKSYF